MTETKTIYQALNDAKTAIGAVRKTDKNVQQGFNFRGIDAVVTASAPALNKEGIITVPQLQDYTYEVVEVGKNKTSMGHVMVRVQYMFIGPAGDNVTATVLAESFDSGDKACAKAMSVAYRIALLQVLNLPTDDRDPDADTYERSAKPTVEELMAKAAELNTVDDLRKHWETVGAAGYLNTSIAHPATGEKLKFQDYLKQQVDELSTKSSTESAPGNTRTRRNPDSK